MSGPYLVETNDQIFSAIQRVVKTRKDRTPSAISNGENTKKTVIGGSLAAVLVVLVIGGLFWWRRRTQRKRRIMKDKEEGEDVGSDSEDPGPAFVGKHELHMMGLIPESESESSSSEHRTSQETSIDQPSTTTTPTTATQGRPRTNRRLPSYTYQDHIRELDFSSHPRPNVVTLVGDREQ
ncbi:hypothetical protein F5H01DRAFT_337268 [Linnemannia elongata]|nr:hypothetical protein F5H01DRAFT_337268 [Linnemannia elongata]